jgi:hypothetical protein
MEVAAFALRQTGLAFLSPQLLDLLRWGRSLATAKAARDLGFRAARDTKAAYEDFVQQRRVLRYQPDRYAYQYEKELEDFIHSRQPHQENGASSDGAAAVAGPGPVPAKAPRRPRRSRSLHRSRS